ncbi:hypothetical protein [Streptomyces sp. NPDC008317]|uniref:hypothetical protein n=1 Tax=Streptomyces sp. NPDC008317 TaxID=3364827 RepID=UPI0036DFD5DF
MSLSEDTPAQERGPEPEPEAPPAPDFPPTPPAPGLPATPPTQDLPPTPPHPPRPRGRTTLLIAATLVLGVLAGGGVGYKIQHDREPTPLPPLTGPALAQPKGTGPDVPALPVAQDRNAVYDGDLLKLLVPTPKTKGTKELERGWQSLVEYADGYGRPDIAFTRLAQNDFRRMAGAGWTDARHDFSHVEVVQFRDEATLYTGRHLTEQVGAAGTNPHFAHNTPVPGTADGQAWGSGKPYESDGYLPQYRGIGFARVGNLFVEVVLDSEHPVKVKAVLSLIKRQLERL